MTHDRAATDRQDRRRVLVTGGSGFIGTQLVSDLIRAGDDVMNLDIAPPNLDEHMHFWREADILNGPVLRDLVHDFGPDVAIHLAARTDVESSRLEDYRVNTEGTRNVLSALNGADRLTRVVVTSTQYVMSPGLLPVDDCDFRPHTAYGLSKAEAERLTRKEFSDLPWVIARPTNVWGPWHPRYPAEFWRVLRKGLYAHPRGRQPLRSYGYVGTVSEQMLRLLTAADADVLHRVLYTGDPPMTLDVWVDGFSRALTGRPARRVPRSLLTGAAAAGTALGHVGIRAPLTLSRYRSMTEDYPTPMEPTFAVLGMPSTQFEDNVAETVQWLSERRAP